VKDKDLFNEIIDDLTVAERREWEMANRKMARLEDRLIARALKRKGLSNRQIAEQMGFASESSIRALLARTK
jgi:hypothetical protein